MMKTSIVGFPHIGENRELKKMVEEFHNKEITIDELWQRASLLKCKHWRLLKGKGIDFIPSNDFSFYDRMLDSAVMINVIPKRFRSAGIDDIQRYFAMARGYQDSSLDLKALDMKKWFSTNYHYVVPELEEGMDIRLVSNAALNEYREALAAGVSTRPTMVGPYTFCKLLKGFTAVDYRCAEIIARAYSEVVNGLRGTSCEWVQIEEPALVLDMDSSDRALFLILYKDLLRRDSPCKILLQTYFGDIRDVYDEVMSLPFDAVGLDFIDGPENASLISQRGFPDDRLLIAGIVNGRNVWANDYHRSLRTLNGISEFVRRDSIVAGASCSLLHVPFSTKREVEMEERCRRQLSFAVEKLNEIIDIAFLFGQASPESHERYRRNREIVEARLAERSYSAPAASAWVSHISGIGFFRTVDIHERRALQKDHLRLPLYPTSTIGSFPQTAELRRIRREYREGRLTDERYRERLRELVRAVIRMQEELELDVLVHGEFERNDMVEYFGERLDGFLHTEHGWVQSYGSRCVKPPVIFGDIRRKGPITVEWITYAQGLTEKPVKGILTGPVTILNWSFARDDVAPELIAYQIALAIRDEVLDLEKAGIKIIQIDEAALREKLPVRRKDRTGYLSWAVRAFRITCSAVRPETQIQTHMCYSEFSDIMESIKNMDADVILIESARSNLSILESFKSSRYPGSVGPGVYDIHSPRVPGEDEMYEILKNASSNIPPERLWVNPDCGLKTRGYDETVPSLKNMVRAARRIRDEFSAS